jgi:uncharacterized heparinase superfamily protein
LPDKRSWLFSAPGMAVELEESVFLSPTDGPRRTSQIVISEYLRAVPRVVWTFVQESQPQPGRQSVDSEPQLPL